MKVLVIGKDGQLGSCLKKKVEQYELTNQFTFIGRNELDFNSNSNIENYFNNNVFDIIINCAAFTAVDKAESEKETANQVNHLAVKQLAKEVLNQGGKLIHISTDYVFDGLKKSPYEETDKTNPINVYGITKLDGENAIKKILNNNGMIIRVSWVYSEYGNNFVKTMLRMGNNNKNISVVKDQIGSPTNANDLAGAILSIIQKNDYLASDFETETYHFSNEGEISWYDFAQEIFRISNFKSSINSVSSSEYPTVALRPKNTSMNKTKIKTKFNIEIMPWEKSLEVFLNEKNLNLS